MGFLKGLFNSQKEEKIEGRQEEIIAESNSDIEKELESKNELNKLIHKDMYKGLGKKKINEKNLPIISELDLSDEVKTKLFSRYESLGLQTIYDLYSKMDFTYGDDTENFGGRLFPDKWSFHNFDDIIEWTDQSEICMDVINELDKEKSEIKIAEQEQEEYERLQKLKELIITLLKEKNYKSPASDIDAHLRHQDIDEIKELCEKMYHNGDISRTANYRYFILTEEKKKPKPKKASAPKSESTDIPEQIKKLSDLKDQGILTEEEFQSKKKDLLDKM